MPTPSSEGPRPQGDGMGQTAAPAHDLRLGAETPWRNGESKEGLPLPFPSTPSPPRCRQAPRGPRAAARRYRRCGPERMGGKRRRKNRIRRKKRKKKRRKRRRAVGSGGRAPGGGAAHGLGSTRWSRAYPHATAAPRTLPAGCRSWAALRSRRRRRGPVLG